jgi:hypothetical protein
MKVFTCGMLISSVVACEATPPDPVAITIRTFTPPALLAVQHEGSPDWHAFTTTDKSRFVIGATGPYRVAIACDGKLGGRELVRVKEFARTIDDSHEIDHDCRVPAFPHLVRGVMKQPGRVFLGDSDTPSLMADEAFTIGANPGTFDLVMLFAGSGDGAEHIAIRRALTIDDDMDLEVIDATQEETSALVPVSFRCSNCATDGSLASTVHLLAGNTGAGLSISAGDGASWRTRLVPDAALQASDRQRVQFVATTQAASGEVVRRRSRHLARDVRVGDPTEVTLPQPLGDVTFERTPEGVAARWSALPVHDTVSLFASNFTLDEPALVECTLEASETFIAAVGATSLTLDTVEIPGFESAHGLAVAHVAPGGDATTLQVSERPSEPPRSEAEAARR